jgi:hypothetical protein
MSHPRGTRTRTHATPTCAPFPGALSPRPVVRSWPAQAYVGSTPALLRSNHHRALESRCPANQPRARKGRRSSAAVIACQASRPRACRRAASHIPQPHTPAPRTSWPLHCPTEKRPVPTAGCQDRSLTTYRYQISDKYSVHRFYRYGHFGPDAFLDPTGKGGSLSSCRCQRGGGERREERCRRRGQLRVLARARSHRRAAHCGRARSRRQARGQKSRQMACCCVRAHARECAR